MQIPTLEEIIEQLKAVSGAQVIDPDTPLPHVDDLDSLDLMEWLYGFQEEHPDVVADESLFESVDDTTTMRAVYAKIVADTERAAATA